MNKLEKIINKSTDALSRFYPRQKDLFVFIGWHKSKDGEIFADNAKHFFLYIHREHPEIRSVWISKDRALARRLRSEGFRSYYEKSILGIWYSLRAGYVVIDAFLQKYNAFLSRGAKITQLLHGKGLKKKGYAQVPILKNDFIFGTSPFTNSLLPVEFTSGAQMCVAGYSRNDQFFDKTKLYFSPEEKKLVDILETHKRNGKKIIMYAPTFRRGNKDFNPEDHFNKNRVSSFAKEKDVIFLVSLHTKYRARKALSISDTIIDMPECDINSLMPFIDILITDYSSSYVDFLLLDRPIIFYVYDIESYHAKEGLIDDYESHMPGAKVKSEDALFIEIERVLNKEDDWVEARASVRDLYHTHKDANSSARIFSIINSNK